MRHTRIGGLVFETGLAFALGTSACATPAGPTPSEQAAPTTAAAGSSGQALSPPAARHRAPVREGGTLVRSATGDTLLLADEDHGVVRLIPLPVDVQNPPKEVKIPGAPAQVLALDGRVLVTVRSENAPIPGMPGAEEPPPTPYPGAQPGVPSGTGPGLLLILKPDADSGLVEVGRVALPQDAWGLAISPDESTVLVTSAWSHKVSAVDLATATLRWTVDVAREPRAVVIAADGKRAYVAHLVGADLTRIDDLGGEPSVHVVGLPASPLRSPYGQKTSASLAYSATLSPDGKRLFVARHALGAEGPQVWFGAATVDVLRTTDDTPLAPARSTAAAMVVGMEPQFMLDDAASGGRAPREDPTPFAQPRAMAYRARSKTLLVLGEGNSRMVELDAQAPDPTLHVLHSYPLTQADEERIPVPRVCGAPSGIALSEDEQTAYVHCRSTNDLLVWSFAWDGPRPTLHLGGDLLPADAALGRRIYYDGTDGLTSGGMGCAGCHPEGRDDGHVWHETRAVTFDSQATFVSGRENAPSPEPEAAGLARQTPMLAGRVFAEGPYGWHGESSTLVQRITAGFGLHRWGQSWMPHEKKDIHDRAMALRAFLRRGLAPPPRPGQPLSEQEQRGKAIFGNTETGCATCHVPEMGYSDRESYAIHARLPPRPGFAEDPEKRYKTPSLRFVGGTAPYLHDGRFPTLRALIDGNGNQMGHTSHLVREDRDALIAFLETL